MTVEIIGRASIAPGADSIEELQLVLKEGRCTVTRIPDERWDLARFWHPVVGTQGKTYSYAAGVMADIYSFDPAVFGLSQREAMQMDPQQRILLNLVWRALEDANLPVDGFEGERVGVYVGASSLDHGNLTAEDPAAGSPYFMAGNTLSIVSNRISHIFGLRGPSMTIDTACSSSLVALDQAVRALECADIDTAIVGGINLLVHPLSFVGFSQARMLSPEGLCRAYDDNGRGYVRAEGGAAIVLRRTDRALREKDRSYARIHAVGVNSSGRTNGISLPSRDAQAALLRSIYEGQNIDVNRVAFVEGHGTGTKVGDPAEIWAIGDVIGRNRRAPVPVGSIKSNIGHTEPASGLFGLLKAMIALENNFLPASLHFQQPNETIDFEGLNVRVNTSAVELLPAKRPRFAGINSFGFGGTNAHVVISDPDPVAPPEPQLRGEGTTFIASAHTASALSKLLEDYKSRLERAEPKEARQIIASAAANREPMRHRFAAKAKDSAAVLAAIDAHLGGENSAGEVGEVPGQAVKIAFVFSGNGSQWAGMGIEAYRENSHFRQCFQSFSALFEYYLGQKLTDILVSPDLSLQIADTKIAQPLLFAIQASLSDCFSALGVKPDAVLGHSVGEIAAAYAAKALTAAEAVAIVAKRSLHQDLLAGEGKMAAVVLNEDAALAFAKSHGLHNICIAAINAPNSITISGPVDEIEAFREAARKSQIVAHILDINYPFHHPIIDRAKDAFLADLPDVAPDAGLGTFISTVTGAACDGHLLDAEYWWRNVRDPVLFKAACQAAMAMGCNLFIEIAPRPILSNYVTEIAKQASVQAIAIPTLLREPALSGRDPVSQAFARAVAHGAPAQRSRGSATRNAFVKLPPLPFEPVGLRSQPTTDEIDIFGRDGKSPYTLLGWRTDPNASTWKNHLDAHLFADLAEHVVDGKSILPGSGFIEIAVIAVQRYYQTDAVEIGNLEIVRPLELRQDRMVELSTILSPETGDIEIRSRERLSNDDWTVHAVARGRKPTGNGSAEDQAARRFEEQKSVLTSEKTYETAERFGLQYGPHFQLLSKAVAFGRNIIEVDLKPAAAPTHPFVTYNLNPMSIDAAFHGLVALFDQLSGDEAGAPYIPVRFGTVRVAGKRKPVVKAIIEIDRFSNNSIKARFRMFGGDGDEIAVFDDCRFRRTYLRRHTTLDSVAFHYETVPSTIFRRRSVSNMVVPDASPLRRLDGNHSLNNATLLLDAAIYRACHEIALTVAGRDGAVSLSNLPGDPEFRPFLINCLYILEDAGIASGVDGGWHIPLDFTLPTVSEALQELYREDAGRVAEAILVNNAYREALERLAAVHKYVLGQQQAEAAVHAAGGATLEHVLVHSPLSGKRLSLIAEALVAAVEANPGSIGHILEAGSTSTAFSQRLAAVAANAGACLIIAEPREQMRRALEIAFEGAAHVIVTEPGRLGDQPLADVIIACGDQSQLLLSHDDGLKAAIRSAAARGAQLLFADRAPSVFNDFAFGLSEGWFAGSQSSEFPVGQLGTLQQVEDILAVLGFSKVQLEEQVFPEGGLITAAAASEGQVEDEPALSSADAPLLVLSERGEGIGFSDMQVIAVDVGAGSSNLAGVMTSHHPRRILYVAEREGARGASDPSQMRLEVFKELADTLIRYAEGDRPRLVIMAPGGSPLAKERIDSANAGLWAFARVLQNEYDGFDVHLLDAETDDKWAIAAIETVLFAETNNREWALDRVTGEIREIRAVAGPFAVTEMNRRDVVAATIRQHSSGRLDSVVWEASDLPAPSDDEVIIAVEATGLNFRDVMWAMGLLPEEALEDGFAGATIGMEFAGRVLQTGSGVGDLQPGDKVMGIGPAAFSTHVRVRRDGVTKLPETMDTLAAATVPVAFLTAYYAMVELGRIQPGETILIHGAAGGVGLAALQIAKFKGAKVIATAGTIEKRRFLQMLGADHVLDSRSLDFVAGVRHVTGGEGVDLVLNSLFSEAMERSIELVKPFGRFLELGKRDYYSDRKIGLRPFRRNISYFGIDADQLLVNAPALTKRIFAEIGQLFADHKLTPLPYRAFGYDEIGSAFRLMQNAGHIGKIVVRPPVLGVDHLLPAPAKSLRLDPAGIFLVAGGIGGFGLAAADWLVSKGARRIALCSRRGVADEETEKAVGEWEKKGVVATLHVCDITDEVAVEALLGSLRSEGALKGIIHAAMVLDDALLANLTPERNRPVIDVKVRGADNLHRLTQHDRLDLFLLFSSATTMLGNPGQANYVAANGYLEGLARARRAAGLPALAIGFGAIADKGFLARNIEVNELLSKRIGKAALKARDALEQVERYMLADTGKIDAAAVMIAEIDWSAARMLPIAARSLFEPLMRHARDHNSLNDGDIIDLGELIKGKSEDEAQAALHIVVASEIAAILRVTEDTITPDKVLKDIGLDSLMAMELGISFQQKTGFDIPLSGIGEGTTVSDVVSRLRDRVMNRSGGGGEVSAASEDQVVSRLVQSHSLQSPQKRAAQS
ncbi:MULTISPECIES: type I polyketide synthase [Rhizobium]|uniref:Acyl transferase domain-containing protein/NADPH:quinone reductase-like Zn-dependent oxidoreductase/acyl carrier protein/short-subunit dehydrogenase n=1 Tax=Rhizobium paranaense TaxID=1650438 RepID=A0A7W9CZF7_9HYPH|nr:MULTISPECIES: type I polyketide synthase [Rhizobium]MBB5572162.1 acyl transferase domain-containing protein/NADPH:quinone reductase-like Zn-dependent oxidoreductase/acyl carrier protein/short-subunit dehydrogenase [Rhizobium paranaense]PST63252.1 beta-ketoacyl synthase [Rhizobium sp. SEMIA4064]